MHCWVPKNKKEISPNTKITDRKAETWNKNDTWSQKLGLSWDNIVRNQSSRDLGLKRIVGIWVCQSICICEGKLNLRPKVKTQKGQYNQGMVGKNLPACSNGNPFISANAVSKVTTIKIASPAPQNC